MNSQRSLRVIVNAALFLIVPAVIAASLIGGNTRLVPKLNLLFADGGAPVPPYPKPPTMGDQGIVVADGGAPVPPYPKPPVAASNVVIADGGAPVPPYPKPPAAATA
jgi:hypothetical protein